MAELVTEMLKHWPGRWEDRSDPNAVHEAKLLQLATDKANALLGWAPVWTFPDRHRADGAMVSGGRQAAPIHLRPHHPADSTLFRRA